MFVYMCSHLMKAFCKPNEINILPSHPQTCRQAGCYKLPEGVHGNLYLGTYTQMLKLSNLSVIHVIQVEMCNNYATKKTA